MRMISTLLLYLSLLLPAVVSAANMNPPQTGQTIINIAKDDGDLRAGKSWPAPRFNDNKNNTITDTLTGLVWSNDANLIVKRNPELTAANGTISWQSALDYVAKLNSENYLGYNDWRLPNLNELASVLNQGEPAITSWLGRQGIVNTVPSRYWTATSVAFNPTQAWTINLETGSIAPSSKSQVANVWAVRGGDIITADMAALPKTGQSVCYNTFGDEISCAGTGQDGELLKGIEWPTPRFYENSNETVTDNLTGLIWVKYANLIAIRDPSLGSSSDGRVVWPDAIEYVNRLNKDVYLGYSDWRLPNRNELVSLINYAESNPAIWLSSQGFSNAQQHYWSSSTSANTTSNAWNASIAGDVSERNKYDSVNGSFVWPVRGSLSSAQASVKTVALQSSLASAAPQAVVAAAAAALSVSTSSLTAGTIGTAYSQTLAATGGTTPYTWTKTTGSLPAGLALSTAGVISGTPTTAGTSTFTVQVKDKSAATATKSLSIIVNAAPLSITTASLADGYLTTAYSQTLAATGGKTAYTWSVTSGTLPAGLTLAAATGVISGTPTAAGTSSITIQVKDANNTTATKALSIVVYALPSIATTTLPAGTVNTAYSQTLAVNGGKSAFTWSVSSGTLPTGLTLTAATGVLSGTPTAAGTSSVTFKVTDANAKTATQVLSVVVNAAPLSVTTASLVDGYLTTAYSQTLAATGGKTAYTWSITSGALPAGLTLAAATGIISGTPTVAGTSSITVQVKDANNTTATKALSIVVYAVPSVTTTTLPAGTVNTAYSQTLAVSGGKSAYTWSVSSGTLPTGLALAAATGIISGTPTVSGTSSVTFKVTDANAKTATMALSMVINAAPLSITTASLADGYLTTAYSQTLVATGGKTAYAWSVTAGALPTGLSLAASTGIIAGTPSVTGTSTITTQVKDANTTTATKSLTITVYALPSITTATLPAVGTGTAYNQTLTATGGKAPITWSVSSGTLPVGLALDANSGAITGTPTTAGTSSVTFKVTDANAKTATKALSIVVNTTPPTITTTTLNNGAVGVSYSQTLAATGGKPSYTWSKTAGSLPAGLSLSTAGVISGKPTTLGTSNFTVQVKDANNSTATKALSLTVAPPLTIDTSQPTYGTVGGNYSYTIPATGGSQPYTWSVIAGTLPIGLTLNAATGVISGIPTVSGSTETITIQVKDASNATATGDFWLYNVPALQITTNSVYDSYVGFSYGLQLASTGGLPPISWAISSGSLPSGLSIDSATGKISGTTTTLGTSSFTVQIKDSNNAIGTKAYSIVIANYGSISGVVTDQATGAPLAGVAVNLGLSGITSHNIDDLIYTCNNATQLSTTELRVVAENDGDKYKCDSYNTTSNIMLFKVRNPFGAADSFTVNWNGIGAFDSGYEYLAQEFKPTRSGLLTKASFHLPEAIYSSYGPMVGTIRVMLKTTLGGDIGTYLAISDPISVADYADSSQVWVDFTFPAPAAVTSGQHYYLEITGKYYAASGNYGYYTDITWDGSSYTDVLGFVKEDGVWTSASPLAFRTYLDGVVDATTDVIYNNNLFMYGGNFSPYDSYVKFSMVGGSTGVAMTFNGPTADSDGDDITGTTTVTANPASFYDANGWLQAQFSAYLSTHSSGVSLVTDQFNITFNRSFTAVTNANGEYSFQNLPDGKYTVAIDKAPYNTEVVKGNLLVGQVLPIQTALTVNTDFRIDTNRLTVGAVRNAYSHIVTAAGGTLPYTWSVVAGALPAGLALDSSTGKISGTPTSVAPNYFVIQVQDVNNKKAAKGFTIRVFSTPVQPSITISPLDVGFGYKAIGNSYSAVVSVTNSGSSVLTIGQIVKPSTAFYQITNDTCSGKSLAAAAACTVTVQFSPTHSGVFYDTFDIPSSDENFPDMWVNLSGEGIFSYFIPDTGRGEYIKNPISFAVNTLNSATDTNTQLMWQRNASAAAMAWSDADSYCKNLGLDGYHDWRLPNFVELTSIVNYGTANPTIDSALFPATHPDKYWSATGASPQYATWVNFAYGESDYSDRTASAFVRCARGEELQNKLTVNIGTMYGVDFATYIDQNTRLAWTGAVWNSSNASCDMVNSVAYAGYQDWRVPTIKEFATMPVQSCASNNCLAWTATSSNHPDSLGNISQVYLYSDGFITSAPKTDDHPLRCVRGGNQIWQIDGISATGIVTNGAAIQWITRQPTTGLVEFGETTAYGSSVTDANMTTQHSITLSGLTPATTYHFRITATTAQGVVSSSADQTFTTSAFSVKGLGDTGNVTVIETAGNYDAKKPDGSTNDLPRQEIAKEYIRTHGDNFDFLVFVSTFNYTLPEAGAEGFYLPVRNDVQGINQPIFDNSAQFGSASKLQGTIDLGNISQLATAPYGPLLDTTVRLLNHELGHRFGSYVRFKNPDGSLNTSLLGKDSAHWSYLLDSKGSIMYGNGWKDNQDGTFTSMSARSVYSPLDLYLMGMIPKEQVPPMLLIDNPAIDKTLVPQLGVTVTGTAKTVTIDDIVAAEGERIPNAATAQKKFNVGFVLLTRPGDNTNAATQAIETLRIAWAGSLADQTSGIGGISGIAPAVSIIIESPVDGATITGPDVSVSGTMINSSGAETGVTVNGIPATVSGGRFIANHVPLQQGSNTITIMARDANGLTSATTRNVTAQAGNYIRIVPNIESGTAPLNLSIHLNGSFTPNAPTITTNGPVALALIQGVSTTDFTAQLTVEGTYSISVSAIGPDVLTYTDNITITVINRNQLENLMKAKWEGINAKVYQKDIEGALQYLLTSNRDDYRELFTALGDQLPQLGMGVPPIEFVYANDSSMKGRVFRQETVQGQNVMIGYPVYFEKEDGIWRFIQY